MRKKLWKPEDIEFVFLSYNKFEERLLEFLKIIPYDKINKECWSPELVSLFLDICGLIDSMARYILSEGKIGENRKISITDENGKQIEKEIKWLNMYDFKLNIFNQLELEKYQIILYLYSVYPDCIIKPYQEHIDEDGDKWWDVYNKLKHDRLNNYKKANLHNILKSLSALFLFIVTYDESEEFTNAILRHKWIDAKFMPEFLHEQRLKYPEMHWYDTNLFGVSPGLKNISLENVEKIPRKFNSKKLSNFIGKYNR